MSEIDITDNRGDNPSESGVERCNRAMQMFGYCVMSWWPGLPNACPQPGTEQPHAFGRDGDIIPGPLFVEREITEMEAVAYTELLHPGWSLETIARLVASDRRRNCRYFRVIAE